MIVTGAYLYIVRCSDGSLYTGTTRGNLEGRIGEHNAGHRKGYTETRRPVVLVFSEWFDRVTDAIENERKLEKWSRAKKEAFILQEGSFHSWRHRFTSATLSTPPASSFETPGKTGLLRMRTDAEQGARVR